LVQHGRGTLRRARSADGAAPSIASEKAHEVLFSRLKSRRLVFIEQSLPKVICDPPSWRAGKRRRSPDGQCGQTWLDRRL